MNISRVIAAGFAVAVATSGFGAQPFRTDINPALRYYQAFLETPKLAESDHEYLFEREWRGQSLDKRFGELVSRYDYQFRFLREAAQATAPCNWGIDLTLGPDALLPGLAPARATAQMARLRVLWHLQNGRQAEARDDVLAVFALARNVSRDGILISALVQFAMEHLVDSIITENFFQWQPETLQQIVEGLEAAPARGTIAQSIRAEKQSFHDWLLRKVQELQRESAGDESKTLARLTDLFAGFASEGESKSEFAARVLRAAGGKPEGVLRLVRELAPLYDQVAELMTLPHGEFEVKMTEFMAKVAAHPNPLVTKLFTVFDKCRAKEFAAAVKLATLRAGVAYKLRGAAGLNSVTDPIAHGPFVMRRFIFEGEDRGFELRSKYAGRGHEEVLIFVEKNGPPVMVDGKNAGQRVPASN